MSLSAERLFQEQFAPLYPKGSDLEALRATDANPGNNPALVAELRAAAAVFARLAPAALGDEGLALDFSDASVHRLGHLLTREKRDAWLVESAGDTSLFVKMVIHGALYVGACVVERHGGEWLVRRPSWESRVRLVSTLGEAELAPFSWWLKALSDEEVGTGRLADRYRLNVELATFDGSKLPVLAPPDRRIPRLARVRYHALHQHLRAHLPEIRDVGADFPSPERFDQYKFAGLEFALVGGGRYLLMHGLGEGGLHMMWLGPEGLVAARHRVVDPSPAPVVRILPEEPPAPERVQVTFRFEGKELVEEIPWWGR